MGLSVNKKIVVLESDDWGMIRTSSNKALEKLSQKYPLQSCNYSKNDSLEREEDVQGLLDVLTNNQSKSDENAMPIFTLNYVTHNPNFREINKSQFQQYFRESNLETYAKYERSSGVPKLIQTGITNRMVLPQYHATEHININNWLLDLQNGGRATLEAFNYEMANLHKEQQSNCSKEYLDAFGFRTEEKAEPLENTLKAGLSHFEKLFGFKSQSIIAPCYLWDDRMESVALEHGVKAFQGGTVQKIPLKEGFKKKRHYMGQKGASGQRYFIRNCQFERVDDPQKDWVDSCLKDIETAFRFKKPAIISTHRVNYMGRLNEGNRTKGLKQLDLLLKEINKRWPEVQYLSTPDLLNKYYN
jgi:hypothetical protein